MFTEVDLEGGAGGAHPPPPFFLQLLVFLRSLWITTIAFVEVKLIINNAPLTYPNAIKTYLTPSHFLFGRQLLCYSNTTSAVIRNLTVLWSTSCKINRISNHFWHRWRHEYVVNLCETQWASKLNINFQELCCACLWGKGALTLLENCHSNRGIT